MRPLMDGETKLNNCWSHLLYCILSIVAYDSNFLQASNEPNISFLKTYIFYEQWVYSVIG